MQPDYSLEWNNNYGEDGLANGSSYPAVKPVVRFFFLLSFLYCYFCFVLFSIRKSEHLSNLSRCESSQKNIYGVGGFD